MQVFFRLNYSLSVISRAYEASLEVLSMLSFDETHMCSIEVGLTVHVSANILLLQIEAASACTPSSLLVVPTVSDISLYS